MRKRNVRTIVAILVFLLVVFGAYRWFMKELVKGKFGAPSALRISVMIGNYIRVHGHFPESEADLQDKGYIKITETPDGRKYFVPIGQKKTYWFQFNFDSFEILYGASPENYRVIAGILYDKRTGQQVLLIDGPYKKDLHRYYESISLRWYELMLGEGHPPEHSTESIKKPKDEQKQ
ncbi:MAG: hypothetical protein ACYSTF_05805 [Planctomycetota bacterium]|jgi:hypothetical protein